MVSVLLLVLVLLQRGQRGSPHCVHAAPSSMLPPLLHPPVALIMPVPGVAHRLCSHHTSIGHISGLQLQTCENRAGQT